MKTRASRRNYITKWLFVMVTMVAILVAAISVWSFVGYRSVIDKVNNQTAAPDPTIAIDIVAADLDVAVQEKLDDSLQRPLLFSTRRPIVEVIAETEEEPEAPVEIETLDESLVSVILTDSVRMIFLSGGDGVKRLEQGMIYKGWTLSEVNKDSAVFNQGEQTTVLQLRTFANTSPVRSLRSLGDE